MIIGDCPYPDCDEYMHNPIADGELPQFQKLLCGKCNRTIWLYHSRFGPMAYTEEDFNKEFEVDEVAKSINRRDNI